MTELQRPAVFRAEIHFVESEHSCTQEVLRAIQTGVESEHHHEDNVALDSPSDALSWLSDSALRADLGHPPLS